MQEPDHDEAESEALARYLRPINPDPLKPLSEAHRKWLSKMMKESRNKPDAGTKSDAAGR